MKVEETEKVKEIIGEIQELKKIENQLKKTITILEVSNQDLHKYNDKLKDEKD